LGLIVAQVPSDVATHVFRTRVQLLRTSAGTDSFRVTVPAPLIPVLDVTKGDDLVWSYDPTTRKVSVSKGAPASRTERSR
jgi:hypothetical protein